MSSNQPSEYAIEVTNLSKCHQIYDRPSDRLKQMLMRGRKQYYKEFWAIKEVSFKIKKGETVGIIGRNGSGKSTLLQMICGTLNPSNGHIQTFGRVAALLELGSGFNPEFTGRENVFLNGTILGLSQETISQRFSAIEAFADIGTFIDQPVKTYSSGMLVRLAFSVIAHVDADILVIDEALAVGDAFFTQKCMRFLRSFMQTGTVLFVSHDTGSVRSLCTHAIWIEKGKIIGQGTPKEICEDYLEAFYEAQQGKSTTTNFKAEKKSDNSEIVNYKDQRSDLINTSNLRNDLQVFEFDQNANAFGLEGAVIRAVKILDAKRHALAWIVGGETVILSIEVLAHEYLDSPIIGFYIKDRLGQALFGDNTYLSTQTQPVVCEPGQLLYAEFTFSMPRLAAGNYSITVAIANGTQEVHVQHHWVHDAVHFKSESTSVTGGLIGIPMLHIALKKKITTSSST